MKRQVPALCLCFLLDMPLPGTHQHVLCFGVS